MLYPTVHPVVFRLTIKVNLSHGTEVTLINDDYPTFNIGILLQYCILKRVATKPTIYHFHFGTDSAKKGLSISLRNNDTAAYREEAPKGTL